MLIWNEIGERNVVAVGWKSRMAEHLYTTDDTDGWYQAIVLMLNLCGICLLRMIYAQNEILSINLIKI